LQLNDVKASGGRAVIVPPVAVIGSEPPAWVAPIAFVTPIEAVVAPAEIVAVTTATTPFWMTFASSPLAVIPIKKQVYDPELPAHSRDLPAAVAAAPALALMLTMLAGA
jgi:hypothetical protein